MNFALVALGGAFGSMLRYGTTLVALRILGPGFPFGTLFVNVLGSFLIGLGTELVLRRLGGSEELRLLLLTGFLGGYTTFSAFSLDVLSLYERGELVPAAAYIFFSVSLSLLSVLLGLTLGRQL